MKVAWATDVHLNFAGESKTEDFCRRVGTSGAAALLLGGDIAEASDLEQWLRFVEHRLEIPVYFVLGNHDFYGSDVASVRERMASLQCKRLHWLPSRGAVALGSRTGLVGHDGWGDARLGNFESSSVLLSDFFLIADLRECAGSQDPLAVLQAKPSLKQKLMQLGQGCAEALRPQLEHALRAFHEVIVLTHVPPFREACWYDGKISGDEWLPFFTCKAMGDVILEMARTSPHKRIRVLCGHTHGSGEAQILPNLGVRTGEARYGNPEFHLLDVED